MRLETELSGNEIIARLMTGMREAKTWPEYWLLLSAYGTVKKTLGMDGIATSIVHRNDLRDAWQGGCFQCGQATD